MKFNITKSDGFSIVQITLTKNDRIRISREDVVYTTSGILYEGINSNNDYCKEGTKCDFYDFVSGDNEKQVVALAPSTVGRVIKLTVEPKNYYFKGCSFLACDDTIDTNITHLSDNARINRTSGSGDLVISAFGDIRELLLDGSAPLFIRYEYLLCFEDTLNYQLHGGDILELRGKGVVHIQTRSEYAFNNYIKHY